MVATENPKEKTKTKLGVNIISLFSNLSIGKKISLGFALVIISTIIAFAITNKTFVDSRRINEEITNNHNPSISQLEQLKLLLVRSKMLINNWAYQATPPENEDKVSLNILTNNEYASLNQEIKKLSEKWTDRQSISNIDSIMDNINVLWSMHAEIKNTLIGIESYNDPMNVFYAQNLVAEGGDIDIQTIKIIKSLDRLISKKKRVTAEVRAQMDDSFEIVQRLIIILGIALAFAGVLIAMLTTRSIVSPVRKLRLILIDLSKGIFPRSWTTGRADEIGEMADALGTVVNGLRRTKDFAISVGSGAYTSNFNPLSDQDELGKSLLQMRQNLKEYSEDMEQKVRERTAEVVRQKEEIQKQGEQITELYEQVKDSILYAKRIQEAILPSKEEIDSALKKTMVLFRPKDIVSGDFYWFTQKEDMAIIAAADCTGHGVPGALMSMIGSSLLNEIVNEKNITDPAEILLALKHGVIKALNKQPSTTGEQTKDGMDIALCCIPMSKESNQNSINTINLKKDMQIKFAGAYNPLWLVRNGEIIEYAGDRQPVGFFGDNLDTPYTNHAVDVKPGDAIYMFSDGYADQFGGATGKKFKYSQFKKILIEIQEKSMSDQRQILNTTIENWMGEEEQIDDILVIGIKF